MRGELNREGDRERETERQKETVREMETNMNIKIERNKDTDIKRDRDRYEERDKQMNGVRTNSTETERQDGEITQRDKHCIFVYTHVCTVCTLPTR